MAKPILKGLLAVSAVGTGALLVDVHRKNLCDQHSFGTAIKHYMTTRGLAMIGKRMHKKMEQDTLDIRKAQDEFLAKRISDVKNTSYGREHKLAEITTREEFVQKHPLTRYGHYAPYVERIAQGEENVMSKERPTVLAMTSGTSGKSSMLPMFKQQSSIFFTHGIAVVYDLMTTAFPSLMLLQKDLKFFYSPRWRTSESGIPIGPNSSSPRNSKQALHIYSTPEPAYDILNEPQALYMHLLFGLKDKNIGILEANFASLIYSAFVALEDNWELLVRDIENGTVNANLAIDDSVRSKLNNLMTPDVIRAKELRQEFEKGWHGIAKRIWPNCNLVLTVATGSFDLYGTILTEKYCKDIALYSPLYAATEGLLGINIDPLSDTREYMLTPRAMFFEFIPIANSEEDQPKTLFLDEVKKGEMYELVITNLSGLFRYRFGDVVRVSGFHNQCPKVEFLYRQGQLLNVRGEKTSEESFYGALKTAAQKWGDGKLVDYCCVESVVMEAATGKKSKYPQYYVFLELEDGKKFEKGTNIQVDEALREKSYIYESFRKKNSIGPMTVYTVQKGTFQKLKAIMLQNTNATSNQFKVPRVIKRPEAVKLMMDSIST